MKHDRVYRSEWKYQITQAQIELLKSRLCGIMRPDPHAGTQGQYQVRSLYFDDFANSCFYDNENGTAPRRKYRIRIYDGSARRILLECKEKVGGKTRKRSCLITKEQAEMLISGRPLPASQLLPELLLEMTVRQQQYCLRPVIIVEYDRIPFLFGPGNVRVTFDRNIRSSTDFAHFLSASVPGRLVMPTAQHLLEVKFDEYLPEMIHACLDLGQLQQTAFSKYYLCRKFSIHT